MDTTVYIGILVALILCAIADEHPSPFRSSGTSPVSKVIISVIYPQVISFVLYVERLQFHFYTIVHQCIGS